MFKLCLHIYFNALYISKHVPKTKPKFYNINVNINIGIPITNPNHITPATSTTLTIIIKK